MACPAERGRSGFCAAGEGLHSQSLAGYGGVEATRASATPGRFRLGRRSGGDRDLLFAAAVQQLGGPHEVAAPARHTRVLMSQLP